MVALETLIDCECYLRIDCLKRPGSCSVKRAGELSIPAATFHRAGLHVSFVRLRHPARACDEHALRNSAVFYYFAIIDRNNCITGGRCEWKLRTKSVGMVQVRRDHVGNTAGH
jgi:hypothetical protein